MGRKKKRPNKCKPVGDRTFAVLQRLEMGINVCYLLSHLHHLLLGRDRWFLQTKLKEYPWLSSVLGRNSSPISFAWSL